MDYTISEIIKVTPNAYQTKTSVRFKVHGVEHQLSTLTDFPDDFQEGAVVNGVITAKEKDGRTFYNFTTSKKSYVPKAQNSPVAQATDEALKRDVTAILQGYKVLYGQLEDVKTVLADVLRVVKKNDPTEL